MSDPNANNARGTPAATAARPDLFPPDQAAKLRALGLDPTDVRTMQRLQMRAKMLRREKAKTDPNAFCQYVLRDERTGKPIAQAPMHEEWHALLTKHDRLCLWSHVEGGKTNQVALGRVLYELGLNPSLRIAVISNTSSLAEKMVRQLGQYIQKSDELHEVFPHLVPTTDPSLPWKSRALTIERKTMGAKDPSIQACGVHGNIIGSRVDLFVFDDILDFENTHTPVPRDDVYRWVKNVMGRGTGDYRAWFVGNAWHPDDAMHRLEKDGFVGKRFPVISPEGAITWPEVWPLHRIERARGPDGLGPVEFARQLMCQARDDTSARFKREWIDTCIAKGRGKPWCDSIGDLFAEEGFGEVDTTSPEFKERAQASEAIWRLSGKGGAVITGVDLAVSRADSADLTVLFTIYVDPDTGDRRVLNIRSGKWTGPEIINEIERCYEDFGSLFIVENNAAQDYIRQFLQHRNTTVPVVPFTTGRNKAHPEFGVESLATEMSGGKWIIPSNRGPDGKHTMHKETLEWISELLYYDPKEHTGDRVMASWFAREGARRFHGGTGDGGVGVRTF